MTQVEADADAEGRMPPLPLDEDLEAIAREFLTELVRDRFSDNMSEAAAAMGVGRSTLSRVLNGERGFNNLSDWSKRLSTIGVPPRAMFGAMPVGAIASRCAEQVDRLPAELQAAVLAHLEATVDAVSEAGGEPLSAEVRQLIEDYELMPPDRRDGLLATAAIYAGRD